MIRIATWNLDRPRRSEAKRRELLIHTLQSESIQADVWILTETHASVSPGPEFSCVTTEEPDPLHEPGESWVSIWSRFPIERLGKTSDQSRAVAVRIVPEKARPLVIYGTVLPWVGSSWRGLPSKDGAAFSAALATQLSDWVFFQRSNPQCDFVLGGDLNQDLSAAHYYGSRQNKALLRFALNTAQLVCLTEAEIDPVPKHVPTHASIDHICVGTGLTRVGSPISWPILDKPQRSLSDHFGVVVNLAHVC